MTNLMLTYGLRIFWALVLAFLLTQSFRDTYQAEHGKRGWMLEARDDTVVWLDPILFPLVLILYAGILMLPWEESRLGQLISGAVDLFLFVSIYFTLLLLILPMLRRYFTARTCATFWLVPVFLFYQPTMLYDTTALPPVFYLYIPGNLLKVLLYIWLTGFVMIFVLQVIFHINFVRKLKKNSRPAEDFQMLGTWESIKEELDYAPRVELRYSSVIDTPLSVGMRKKKKITYLPEQIYSEDEMKFIFSHELHHIQRNDMHTKFFLRFCNALGWFHPFVWLAVRRAEDDLELSCDEIVLREADEEKRRKYANLLLSTAGRSDGFSTCLSVSAKTMHYRLKAVMSGEKKHLGVGLLFVVMLLSSFCVGRTMLVTERGSVSDLTGIKSMEISKAEILSENYETVTRIKDTEKLAHLLEDLKVEKCIIPYEERGISEHRWISGEFENEYLSFSLTDRYLNIYNNEERRQVETYHICTPLNDDEMEQIFQKE